MTSTHGHSPHAQHVRHVHPVEDYSARRHPEFVVLDIGGELGALVVHTDPELHGVEVEISPRGRDAERSHKQVLERNINGRSAFTAVFDGLKAGTYSLWLDGRRRPSTVKVDAGRVTDLDWRGAASGDPPGGAAA
ncbi:MAG TPA: hypothetical protein VG010_04335 [Solirubrobacteraceae bacterium]|jgi:hypothetical protein|nr:hypothetical protein [Solirubrobacteraceae bacterium]